MNQQDSKMDQARHLLRNLSSQAFLTFGVNQIAYIRAIREGGEVAYGLYAADGSELALIDSFNGAIMAARQNDLEPVTLQ